MTEAGTGNRICARKADWRWPGPVARLVAVTLVLSACSREESFDFCMNHYQVHADHADSIGRLDGTLDSQGMLTMQLQLPAAVLEMGAAASGESTAMLELLRRPDQVYSLESDQPCGEATVAVKESSQGLELEYQSQCGAGNRIRQVNVELFDLLEALEEVEVRMETVAVSKHFAINRLCRQAIFRLQPPGRESTRN